MSGHRPEVDLPESLHGMDDLALDMRLIRGTFSYHARVDGPRPAESYTPRVLPYHPDASVPLEAEQVCWYTR